VFSFDEGEVLELEQKRVESGTFWRVPLRKLLDGDEASVRAVSQLRILKGKKKKQK
jgi:hypothetical protein